MTEVRPFVERWSGPPLQPNSQLADEFVMDSVANHPGSVAGWAGFRFRFVTRLTDPANLTSLPVIAAFLLLRPIGLVAPIPYWALAALVVTAALVNSTVIALLPNPTSGWQLTSRVGAEMAVIALVVYGIGWGPILAVGFVFCAADVMRSCKAAAATSAIVWTVVFIGVGQLAIALGLAPTLIKQPLIDGLAVLGALGAVFTIKVLQWFAIARESSEVRFKTLVQHASDLVAVVDGTGQFSYLSPSFSRVLGWEPSDFDTRPAVDLLHPRDLVSLRVQAAKLAGASGESLRSEIRLQHVDGSLRWFEATVVNHLDDPNVAGIVANLHDITDRKVLEDELRHQAFHDSLTTLANRALFTDRIEHALVRQSRTLEPLAVLLVDVDDFKAVNDSLGHGIGDRLLVEIAAILRSAVRAADTVARFGGDEFAILLEDPYGADGPEEVAERILAAFATPITIDDRPFVVSTSVGSAVASPGTCGADELIRNADVAMYAAKSQGKGRWVPFEAGMHVAIQKRLELKTDLFEAVSAGDQMELYYQPLVDLSTRRIVGVEALLRWNHPQYGLVQPLDFLPLAEESGLIIPLGHWVLGEAVTQLINWRGRHLGLTELTMAVNVSARQLEDPQFVGQVAKTLAVSDLDPSTLVLEITESILMRPDIVSKLSDLKELGVRLAIDDFGTGYSSLGYLQQFPVDVLKLDRSFVSGMADTSRQAALTEAVVRMGERLNLHAVAEGVELEEQAEQLLTIGCAYAQGYLFARPLPARDCEALFLGVESHRSAP